MSKYTSYGNITINSNNVSYGNDSKEQNEIQQLQNTDDTNNSLSANTIAGVDGGYKNVALKGGLQLFPVIPRWRKNTPNNDSNADNLNKMAVINRLSYSSRISVVDSLLKAFDEEQIDKEFDAKLWSKLLSDFEVNSQQNANSNISKLESSKAKLKAITDVDDLTQLIAKNKLDMGYVNISQDNLENSKAFVRKAINKRVEELKQETSDTQDSNANNYLTGLMNKSLLLKNADNLKSGYLYVFLQTDLEEDKQGNKPYSDMKLFSEYAVMSTKDNYLFKKLDISDYENIDERGSIDTPIGSIQLPLCYLDKDKEAQEINVRVLFSHSQLSGARLKKICKDKPQHLKELDSIGLKDTFEDIYSGKLKQESLNNVGNKKPALVKQSDWLDIDLYPIYKSRYSDNPGEGIVCDGCDLNLLVDDPFGMLLENNDYIQHLNSLIKEVLDSADKDLQFKTAILTNQAYFNPRALGIADITDMTGNGMEYLKGYSSDSALYKAYSAGNWDSIADRKKEIISKGQPKLDEKKVKIATKYYYRQLIKSLIEKAQENGVKYLDSAEMKLRWQDHFSRGVLDYQSAHGEALALFTPLCTNPNDMDMVLNPSLLPTNKIHIDGSPAQMIADTFTPARFTGVTTVEYQLDGNKIKEITKTYNVDTGELASLTTKDVAANPPIKEPAGFAWLDKNILSASGDLHEMFFPTDNTDEYDFSNLDKDTSDEGKYNRTFIGVGGSAFQELLDENNERANRITTAKRDKVKGIYIGNIKSQLLKKLKEGGLIVPLSNFLDGLTTMLNRRSYDSYSDITPKLLNVYCDTLQVPRSAISFNKTSFEDSVDYQFLNTLHAQEKDQYRNKLTNEHYEEDGNLYTQLRTSKRLMRILLS